jgi:hypothetical protein
MWRDFDRVGITCLTPRCVFASSSIANGLSSLKFARDLFQISPEVCNVPGSCLGYHGRKETGGLPEKMMQS